jgi:hypothetical protein
VARDLLSYVAVQDENVIVFHPGIELRHRGEQGLTAVRADDFGEADQNLVIIFEYQFFVDEQRRAGNHICVVDGTGFTAILDGEPARCLETRLVGGEDGDEVIEVSLPLDPLALTLC